MRNTFKLIILLFVFSFFQGSCQQPNNTSSMNTYEWLPTETAPKNYPVYLYKGSFKTGANSFIKIPDKRTINYGWGEIGSIHLTGDDHKMVPEEMSLVWLSYSEHTYYRAEITLPHQKIDSLFQVALIAPKTQKAENFEYISVGIAPGGMITLWMIGTGYQIEIGTYYGTKTEIDFKEMIPTTNLSEKEFIDAMLKEEVEASVIQEIHMGTIPFKRWETYRKKYNWQIVLTQAETFTPEQARVKMLNGEQDVQYFNKERKPLLDTWAVPKFTRIEWQDKNKNSFAGKITFDEDETKKAFETLATSQDGTITLEIEIGQFNDSLRLILKGNEKDIILEKASYEVFSK